MLSMNYDVVVIGGGPAGTHAALSARISNPKKSIALIRREKAAFAPLGLQYALREVAGTDCDPGIDSLLRDKSIDTVIGDVTDRDGPIVTLRDGSHLGFSKLVLALGSVAVAPKVPGLNQRGVFLIQKDHDLFVQLKRSIPRSRHILIVGGGDVGVELADEFARAGKEVTIVETAPHLMPSLVDPELGSAIKEQLENQGVRVVLGTGVKAFVGGKSLSGADLADGRWITADLAIVAVGFRPCTELAQKMGLSVDPAYGIVVDEYLRTSDPDVYAAGDCATRRSCSSQELRKEMLVSTAIVQGRLAGSNLFSISSARSFHCSVSPFCTSVGDMAVGVVGLIENQARKLGIEYVVGSSDADDCYPSGGLSGSANMTVKLIFARFSRELLGAQIRGGISVGECVNMLSILIQRKMTLMEIDTVQIGTHPLLMPSAPGHAIINATIDATRSWHSSETASDGGMLRHGEPRPQKASGEGSAPS